MHKAYMAGVPEGDIKVDLVAWRFIGVFPDRDPDMIRAAVPEALEAAYHHSVLAEIHSHTSKVQWLADQVSWVPSRRAILNALCNACVTSNTRPFGRASRTIALDAGVSRSTVTRGTAWLVKNGWLINRGRNPKGTNLWDVTMPAWSVFAVGPDTSRAGAFERPPVCPTVTTHDAFRPAGLGRAAARVLDILNRCDAPISAGEIAEILVRQPRAVDRQLKKLLEHDLVSSPSKGQWMAVKERQAGCLDAAAERLCTAGISERDRRRFEREREAYKRRGRPNLSAG